MYRINDFASTTDFINANSSTAPTSKKYSKFIEVLKTKWDKINKENVFRYKVDVLRERLLGGLYLLVFNPDRGINRRMPEQIDHICQPFNENIFNFNKVSEREVLFKIMDDDENAMHLFLVNVSPISRYHSLMCPAVNSCLPQVITCDSLTLAIRIMIVAQDRSLRVGFNSLCGLASVNHLHFHLLLESTVLPVEYQLCNHIIGPLYLLKNHPVPAFCFQVTKDECLTSKSKQIYVLIDYLLKNSIAHNLLITEGRNLDPTKEGNVIRIIVWPRKSTSGVKQLTAFNVAVCELSGWFPIFSLEDFEKLTKEELDNELRKWKLPDFEIIYKEVRTLYL